MSVLSNNIYGHKLQQEKLSNAIKSQRLPHALLFAGPEGIGKKKVAFALAQSLLCEARPKEPDVRATDEKSPPSPSPAPLHGLPSACGQCPACVAVEKRSNPHIMFVSPKGLYIKVDTIRELGRFLSLQSLAPARVVIMDSAHQMNLASANSFLKILEEPPDKVYFILISSSVSGLPVTIRSRTQILRFAPLSPEEILSVLKQTKAKEQKTEIQAGQASRQPTGKSPTNRQVANQQVEEQEDRWLVSVSQGSLSELEKWREKKEETKKALQLLRQISPKQELCSLKELTLLVKDREQALFVCHCWQKALREARLRQVGPVSSDTQPEGDVMEPVPTGTQLDGEVLDFLTPIRPNLLDLFFQKTIQMERDLKGHVDSTLVFDHFLFSCRNEIQNAEHYETFGKSL